MACVSDPATTPSPLIDINAPARLREDAPKLDAPVGRDARG
jgi:hypothetical protein